jgi:hypothetical protein
MNAAVPLGQRLALRTMERIEAESRCKGVTSETAADLFILLSQIYLHAGDGAAIAQEFFEGNGDPDLRQELIAKLGFIKSNLILIGAVIDGKVK